MRHVSEEAPSPQHRVGAKLGEGRVELVGYSMEPAEPRPGKTVTLTWYWKSVRPLEGDWNIFTHLVNPETGALCPDCNFDHSTVDGLRSAYPPGRWRPGQYVEDVQRIALPNEIPFEEAEFRIGIYQGDTRLRIDEGPDDGLRRLRGPRFDTGYEAPPLPELEVPRAEGPIAIDGSLDEADWSRAARTGQYVSATDGRASRPRTTARLLHDGEHLYFGFECEDDHIHSTFERRDDELWRQDAVEVFIDPPGTGRDYLEIQVAPTGQIFDTKVHRHPRRDDSWDSGATAAARRDGTLNDDSDVDRSWTAELRVPLSALSPEPVGPTTRWRLNLFRLDDRLSGRAFLAWSPPLANTTHVPERFGVVTFGERAPAEAAAPDAAPDAPARAPAPAPDAGAAPAEAAGPTGRPDRQPASPAPGPRPAGAAAPTAPGAGAVEGR